MAGNLGADDQLAVDTVFDLLEEDADGCGILGIHFEVSFDFVQCETRIHPDVNHDLFRKLIPIVVPKMYKSLDWKQPEVSFDRWVIKSMAGNLWSWWSTCCDTVFDLLEEDADGCGILGIHFEVSFDFVQCETRIHPDVDLDLFRKRIPIVVPKMYKSLGFTTFLY